ncbi:MAG: hypothetical protein A2W61_07785 [Deltaproteobacteria bacterium RIFCSPLOWO2_01_44_7]|nr:MAG: hypothetical protein A2712_01595 [Deltaproteobacteria bacterium RIFCSPHIGHO2_01_FULL_43_49]OGQ27203.1 MAG: hypothetical protein A3D98_02190 [Deltaproteobacteria bacterium RIFCSPHIGHO2_12_FULL_44_21]OGQ31693.1 MAG: hypothetical protein A2979_05040 [Deltaproteobacteria bacterium RIFCSPLOWO2_01_FULL_45_74]OGQ42893.1 MAG: hypothetical protein A3I70_07345 [Deltaproteobacteria bacterium RIFCSPLOWO2_02_FULL_44_34]OGQ43806.1 MAG: hypothetical protein A2W61_07785 [Deltaproteobacteria bacterium R
MLERWSRLGEGVRFKKFSVLILLSHCFLYSCGSSSEQAVLEEIDQEINNAPVSEVKLANQIAFDLVGGIFLPKETIESITISPSEQISTSKLSINVEPPALTAGTGLFKKDITIDSSYSFLGSNGSGRLTLAIFGNGIEETNSNVKNNVIRRYDSLHFMFKFMKFSFENKCLGNVLLSGMIECEIKGDYELEAKNFIGQGNCSTKQNGVSTAALYITESNIHEVSLNVDLNIEGDPLNLGSYQHTGKIIIDGQEKNIEGLIKEGSSCS